MCSQCTSSFPSATHRNRHHHHNPYPVLIPLSPRSNPADNDTSHYFLEQAPITVDSNGAFTLTVRPGYLITVSTLRTGHKGDMTSPPPAAFPPTWRDDFNACPLGGEAPFFMDQNGGWECVDSHDSARGVVMRQSVPAHPITWRPDETRPHSVLGSAKWRDTNVSVDVALAAGGDVALLAVHCSIAYDKAGPNLITIVSVGRTRNSPVLSAFLRAHDRLWCVNHSLSFALARPSTPSAVQRDARSVAVRLHYAVGAVPLRGQRVHARGGPRVRTPPLSAAAGHVAHTGCEWPAMQAGREKEMRGCSGAVSSSAVAAHCWIFYLNLPYSPELSLRFLHHQLSITGTVAHASIDGTALFPSGVINVGAAVPVDGWVGFGTGDWGQAVLWDNFAVDTR